ncbi:hypothetical protein ACJRO7_005461 [Eucalyptus globulus]|uniref:Uncharacterized protein n=1 Tax=Eucalyptus globulus TaxID=34317 RepID=A0ABD3J657_EUCGL
MEANGCVVERADSDVLLPPRKRLLAGMKKQNSDTKGASLVCSPAESLSSSSSSVYDAHLNNLISIHSDPNLSPEEIVEASRLAALAAAEIAKAARAAAEEKAAVAVKAITAAKSALEIVASFSGEGNQSQMSLKRNKLKKRVPVHSLYKRNRLIANCKTDEELARRLHQVMNSSSRNNNVPTAQRTK